MFASSRRRKVTWILSQLALAIGLYTLGYKSRQWITPCEVDQVDNLESWRSSVSRPEEELPTLSPDVFQANHDHPVRDVYFIKVHKTGSTTLQNILYRYGFNNNLTFALFNCENAKLHLEMAWHSHS